MSVLEKILEEIRDNAKLGNMRWESIRIEKVEEIIHSHMSEKEKVSSAEIISRDIGGKPYYEIKYKKVGEDHYTVGYSSYFLDYVIDWLNNYFEFCGEPKIVVDVAKDTNVPSNDGWIPVEERLPEAGEKVKVTVHSSEWIGDFDSNWVPEEDRIYHPEEYHVYDGYLSKNGIWIFYDEEHSEITCEKEFGTDKGRVYDVVTAWMPIELPEPYKGE